MSANNSQQLSSNNNNNNNPSNNPSRNVPPSPASSSSSSASSTRSSSPSHRSSSSSPLSSSDGSSSSSELNPSDALQSPLTGLLNFEGFSMPPQIRNLRDFNISNIDMMPSFPNLANLPNLPPLPALPSFNMPNFQQRIPDLANNLRSNLNLQNLNMPNLNMPNFRNLSYISQLANVNTSAELHNLFDLFRLSANLPNLPQLPQLPQFPPLFSAGQFSRGRMIKPWTHLRESVRNMHRRLNDITQRLPSNFHFHEWKTPDGTEYIRIYFLLNEFIYYCDSPKSDQHHSNSMSATNHDNQQLTHTASSSSNKHHHSSSSGRNSNSNSSNRHGNSRHEVFNSRPLQPTSILIGNYSHIEYFEYDAKSSRFVLTSGGILYYFDDRPGVNEAPHTPIKVESRFSKPTTDFKICPSNPDLVIYHYEGNIWCIHLKTSQEINITNISDTSSIKQYNNCNSSRNSDNVSCDFNRNNQTSSSYNGNSSYPGTKNQSVDAASILVGRTSHVIREEFRRYQSFWWRPESEYHVVNSFEDFSEYQFLYEETDQSLVEIVNVSSWDGSVEYHRFPTAGKRNAVSKLKLAKFKLSLKDNAICDIFTADIIENLSDIFPEYEYLLRAGWLGQDAVWCQLMNRRQTHLVIAIISLSNSFAPQILYEEKNDIYWIGAHDIFYFLNAPKVDCQPMIEGSELSFIWSSEETGFRHLYFIKVRLGGHETKPKMKLKKQLTEGLWEVNEKDFWVDEDEMLIYFCGLRDTPLEKQLYTLSYADCINEKNHDNIHSKTKIHRLTELNYTQSSIAFNANCSIFVNIQSNISVPPFGFVNLILPQTKFRRDSRRLPDSKRLALLLVNSFNYTLFETSHLNHLESLGKRPSITYDCQADLLPGLARPELFCCQLTNGELIYGAVFKPEFMESGVRYPTVLEIYGGPEVQVVSNSFMNLRHPARHLLSSEGYVVVLIDCRGSGRRGISFEAHTYHRMGQVEIADQIEVLKWLAKNTGYIDLNRVAVKGWSYGGYLALMALAQYPKVFKLAIAGAPVTNWQLYDTGYTERYMGYPHENSDGYYKGSVLNYVHLFPDQENKLLILHGLMDENVHFAHTITLIKALVEAGKPYDLQVFPVDRHILKNPMSCENYMTYVLSYLQLNL